MVESVAFEDDIFLPVERQAYRFLDSMPIGSELVLDSWPTEAGWEARAGLRNPADSVRPLYVGRGHFEALAQSRALDMLIGFWAKRGRTRERDYRDDNAFGPVLRAIFPDPAR